MSSWGIWQVLAWALLKSKGFTFFVSIGKDANPATPDFDKEVKKAIDDFQHNNNVTTNINIDGYKKYLESIKK